MDERPSTVLLADYHTMLREGLAELLTSYGILAREFEDRHGARAGAV